MIPNSSDLRAFDGSRASDYGSDLPGAAPEGPADAAPPGDALQFPEAAVEQGPSEARPTESSRGRMSEIPPPAWSAPELGGVAGRDGPMDGMPQRFGKYTLIRKLASGGMAEIFLAIHRSVAGFEKLIVIKRILPAMNQDRQFIDMLLHEARVAATLSHPNIVQIFDVGQVEGTYYIAMEHVHGEDLRSIVRQMKRRGLVEFPIEHALAIVLGTCSGLAYAHEKRELDGSPLNIVHRDISPQNIVVTFTGDVKIVDFGIAKSDSKTTNETKSGKLKGKIPYMSPEQARGDRIDWRSDVFSTAVLLFELTTGKRLFKGQSEYETLKLICERDYPSPSQVVGAYPPELEQIVMRGLAKNREERWQSAREMQGGIEEFVRRNQLKVSQIALQGFMQDLFADKLAAQKEALLHGKQLADIIEMQRAADSSQEFEASGNVRTLSAPAAARTVTDVNAHPRKGGSTGLLVGAGVALVLVAAVGGTAAYVMKQKAAATAATAPATAPAPPIAKGAIDVVSDPPGATIWINGDLRPEVTPAKIGQLPTGRALDVKLTLDGYEQAKQSVSLSEADPSRKIEVKLVKGSVTLEVSVKPAGVASTMTIDGKAFDGSADGLASGVEHKVVVTAPGYREQTLTFLGGAMEKKQLEVTLEKLPASHGHTTAHATAPTGATQTPTAVAPAGNGKLNVSASGGWCNITVDGAAKGPTPVAGIELAAGPHRVVCAPEGKPALTATVTVTPDGVARHKFTIP
jgi:serine/threonine-protein kinase